MNKLIRQRTLPRRKPTRQASDKDKIFRHPTRKFH